MTPGPPQAILEEAGKITADIAPRPSGDEEGCRCDAGGTRRPDLPDYARGGWIGVGGVIDLAAPFPKGDLSAGQKLVQLGQLSFGTASSMLNSKHTGASMPFCQRRLEQYPVLTIWAVPWPDRPHAAPTWASSAPGPDRADLGIPLDQLGPDLVTGRRPGTSVHTGAGQH